MDNQKLFDNFVTLTHGHGQAIRRGGCVFFPDTTGDRLPSHPGCAIGCQPGFRKRFEGVIVEVELLNLLQEQHGDAIREFFGVEHKKDEDFLCALQLLHDDDKHWECNTLKVRAVTAFAEKWSLTIPKVA